MKLEDRKKCITVCWYAENPKAVDFVGAMIAETGAHWTPREKERENEMEQSLLLVVDDFAPVSQKARVVQFTLWEKYQVRSHLLIDSRPVEMFASGLEVYVKELRATVQGVIDQMISERRILPNPALQRVRVALERALNEDKYWLSHNAAYKHWM